MRHVDSEFPEVEARGILTCTDGTRTDSFLRII